MIKKFCDRCGKEIWLNPVMRGQSPLLRIEYIKPRGISPVDLCQGCSEEFEEWVKEYEEE